VSSLTTDFCHLHLHTEFSQLDGNTRITDVPVFAKELGQSAIGVTDHGTMAGTYKFYMACLEQDIKGLFGVETYVTPNLYDHDKDTPTWHLVMIAMNEEGKRNLFRLSEIGWTHGFYKKPRVDYASLEKHSEGVIVLSACMASETCRAIEKGDTDEAVAALRRYKGIYNDRFYTELQPGNTAELNSTLANLASDTGLKTVVTVDSHYDTCNSKADEELLLIMQQVSGMKESDKNYALEKFADSRKKDSLMEKLNLLWPNRGLRFDHHDLYIMGRDEVVSRMNNQGFDGNALADMTLEISERCEGGSYKKGVTYLPKVVQSFDSNDYLRGLVLDGLEERGVDKDPRYIERMEEELAIIGEKNFADYFLVVWDIINEARNRNIYVGPGRGSAAGSLVAYALRITARDPIKRKLLFFRFINAERNDFPDIDMDFEHRGRDEMKEYVKQKYGGAASLSTYSEFQAKGLIKSIARVLSIPLKEVEEVTKQILNMKEFEESKNDKVVAFKARYPEILPIAKKFTGQISGAGMHAAGVVIADRPLTDICPIESRTDPEDKTKRVTVCAFNGEDSEAVGLLKFDFLGLVTLTVIHDCIDLIKERHGHVIDWESLDTDDSAVLADLDRAYTVGVFQMESSAYRRLLKDMGVDSFEDMVASNALVRPGAFDTVAKDYIARKRGLEKVTYPHPDAEVWLKDTYGTYIYQEQVMALSVVLGGFSWSEADKLRKIIGKKKDASEFMPYFEKWMDNASKKIGAEAAEEMWHNFEKHSGYSFNLSHADCYSYIGYVTAYLKHYYPLEYIYSLLKNEKEAMKKMTYLLDAKRMEIPILAPDVQASLADMSVLDVDGIGSLLFGLTDVLNVGFSAASEIMKKREFGDWSEWGS
jgi:DNA polymerase-3 subunit alpha